MGKCCVPHANVLFCVYCCITLHNFYLSIHCNSFGWFKWLNDRMNMQRLHCKSVVCLRVHTRFTIKHYGIFGGGSQSHSNCCSSILLSFPLTQIVEFLFSELLRWSACFIPFHLWQKKQDNSGAVGSMKASDDELTCSVCLEQVNVGEVLRSLPCLHQVCFISC